MNGQQKRYSVTLNAPTAAVKAVGDQLTSYVDQDTVYHLSILDTSPIHDDANQYHTVIRICLDDAPRKSSCPHLTPSKGSADANICAIEYAPFPLQSGVSPQVLPTLHSSLEKSFSVTWSSNSVTGGSYCLIPIKIRKFSGPGAVALKLFAGTERIQIIDATLSRAEQYEESCACVRLFSGGQAQKTRTAEIAHVEQKITELRSAIEQAKIPLDKTTLGQINKDALDRQSKAEKPTTKKRKASVETPLVSMLTKENSNLVKKLSSERKRLSSVRPVQVFRQVVSAQGEHPHFHMPSQQTKHSNTGPQMQRKGKDSKHPEAVHAPIYKSVIKRRERAYHTYTTNTSSMTPALAAEMAERRRTSPVVCFYVRPEHMPNADYTAIYLSKQDFPSLLSAISSKLHVHIGTIGTIYYYDQNMTTVVVNEKTIRLVSHEQDLIVRLPWVDEHSPELSFEAQHQVPFAADNFNDHAMMFAQYLTVPLEESYAVSVGSGSDFTDDASMSMSQMFAQSATLSPEDGVDYEEHHIQHQIVSGEQGIDYASYAFDAIPNAAVPTICLSSAPIQNNLQPAAPLPDPRQTFPPQAETLQVSAIEDQLIAEYANPVKNELADTKLPPSRCSPPVARSPAAERPTSLRNYKRPPSMESSDIEIETSKHSKLDKDAINALERNRLAAMKCRVTRKEKETRLQELSNEKLELNAELKHEIRRLKAEITEAKGLLKMHVKCA